MLTDPTHLYISQQPPIKKNTKETSSVVCLNIGLQSLNLQM